MGCDQVLFTVDLYAHGFRLPSAKLRTCRVFDNQDQGTRLLVKGQSGGEVPSFLFIYIFS